MRCRLALLLIVLLVFANLNAQQKTGNATPLFTDPGGTGSGADPGPGLAALRTDFLSLSPEAEALGKYGSLPVTLFTGQPEISIPIYDLKIPNLDLNFSLSYNYNGYKPNEIASSVGLGWSVQGGGVITRIVKGQIDEGMSSGNRYDDFINPNMLSWSQAFLTKIGTASQDAEPDIYSFNVGGYSGKFILIKSKAYLFPYQNLRITPVGQGFDLVDDKGNDYQFNVFETTFSKIPTQIPTTNFPSAWYVTQITTADKKHTVNFSYIPYTYFQPSVVTNSYTIDSRGLGTSAQTMSTIYMQGDHINALLLSSVNSDYGSITFTHSTNRTDLNGSLGGQSLDQIDVVSSIPGSGFDKELRLNHPTGSGKLSLQSVSVTEFTPTVSSYQYSFNYLGGSQPDQMTYAIDLFGYANGVNNNSMLFPAGTFSPSLYPYADRSAHMQGSQVGMISQITYPTGGYTQFTWEPNQIGHYFATYTQTPTILGDQVSYNAALAQGGITTDSKNFSISAAQTVTLTTYLPNDNLPVPTSPVLLIYDANNTLVYTSPLLTWPQLSSNETLFFGPGTYKMVTQCSSNVVSTAATVNYQANVPTHIDNTLADGPGLRIKNITDYDGVNAAPTSIRNYGYNEGTSFLSNSAVLGGQQFNYCANFFMENFQSSVRGALSELAAQEFYYKDVTVTTQDPTRSGQTAYTFTAPSSYACDVKPVSQTEYKYANYNWLPVKSTNHSYQTTIKYQFNAYKSKVTTVLGPIPPGVFGCFVLASPDPTQAMDLLQIYSLSEPYTLVGDFTTLSSQSETVYSDLDGTPQSSTTAYYYDNTDHALPTRVVTSNSIGETLTTYNSYPLDYHFQGCTGTLSAIQNNFNQDVANCGNVASADLAALTTALAPYQPYHGNPQNQAAFAAAAARFNPVGDYTNAIATAVSNRNTAWTNYFSCLATGIAASTTPWQQGVLSLERNNIISPVIEKSTSLTKLDNSQWLMSATRNEYNLFLNPSSVQVAEPARIQQVETDGSLPYSSFTAAPDNYYKPQVYFGYDGRLNLNEQNKVNNIQQSYLWNYLDVYPVAQVIGAAPADIAYTSFEADNNGNWNFSAAGVAADATCPTGKSAYTLSATNALTTTNALDPTKTYIVSYWSKTGSAYSIPGTASGYPVTIRSHNGWTCYEHKVTGQGQISISGSGGIDEVRLFPDKSLMTTWWYQPLAGMAGSCDPDHHISYYEYDSLGRLMDVKDQDGNIVKTFDYHYRNSGN